MNYRKIIGIVFCLIGFSALGQAQFRYGVKGGMNISSVNFNKDDLFSSQSITGYQVGVTSEYIVPKLGIGADVSIMFGQKGFEQRNKHYTQNYIEIPLNFKWRFSLPFVRPYLHAGPYIAWALGDEDWPVTVSKVSSSGIPGVATVTPYKKDAGLNIGGGIEFLKYFQVGVEYRLGIKDAYKVSYSGSSYAQNRALLINAAVLF